MTLEAPGTLAANDKPHYLRTILCREALRQFDIFYVQFVNKMMEHLNRVIWF